MFSKFTERSYELEHLDKGDYTPEEYEHCLLEMKQINRFLGDAHALRKSLFRDVERRGLGEFSLLDVGAGSGELLRVVAEWAKQNGKRTLLIGLELDSQAAKAIKADSTRYDEIQALRGDGLCLPFEDRRFDYAICSLLTHHFSNQGAIKIVSEMFRVSKCNAFVIDLHRHAVAYYVYVTLIRLLLRNRLTREDGALSILRGFRPGELRRLGKQAGLEHPKVERFFPYRLVLSNGTNSN